MKKRKIEVPLQNGKELKPIMIKPNMGRIIKPMAKFPDLSGDGKVTKKDILMGRGVIDKPKMYNKPKNKVKKDTPERLKIKKTGRELQNALIKEKSKPATQQDKRVINQLQGAIEEQKKKLKNPTMKKPKMYKKPKMGAMNVKKSKTSIDRSSYKKKKLTRSEKLANKASRISKKKTAVVAAKGRSSEKAARIIKKENRIYNRQAGVNKTKRANAKESRVAARATAKSARKSKRVDNLVSRIDKKTTRVQKRVNKTRAMGKLSRLTAKPAMKKPKMYKKKK